MKTQYKRRKDKYGIYRRLNDFKNKVCNCGCYFKDHYIDKPCGNYNSCRRCEEWQAIYG